MDRIGRKQTSSTQILAVCFMICGIAIGQSRQVIQQSSSGAQKPNAPTASGQLRWYSAQGGLFNSLADACQAGFTTLQGMFDKINHLPNVKGPVVTVSMLPASSITYSGAPSFNCNYSIKAPQGTQQKSISVVAVCASPGNVTPAPKSLNCGSTSATQALVSPQAAQATAAGLKSASPPADSAATLLAYLQQIQNSFQGSMPPNDSRRDQPLANAAGNTSVSVSSAPPASSGANAGPSVPSVGIGSFKGSDVVLTAYGCFRAGAIVLCDFDVTKQNSAAFKASVLWSSLGLRDDSGRVAKRYDAFFLASDGTRQPLTTLSTNPVRLIMEFTDVDAQLSTVSLVNGQEQILGVSIDMADPGQPEGTVPDRLASAMAVTRVPAAPAAVATSTSLMQSTSSAKSTVNPVDAANNAIAKAGATVNKVNQGAAKAKDAKDTLKGLANALKGLGK
jgi:hypothetical protein